MAISAADIVGLFLIKLRIFSELFSELFGVFSELFSEPFSELSGAISELLSVEGVFYKLG